MKILQQSLTPLAVLTAGLAALGIVAGIPQGSTFDVDETGESAFVLLAVVSVFALPVIIASTSMLLSSLVRTPGYRTASQSEGRLGGILVTLPLLVALLSALVGDAERSLWYVPILMLNVLAVAAGFWFLLYCIGHVLAQNWRTRVKALWVVLLLLGTWVTMPIYWWVFIARPRSALPSQGMKEKQTWQR